MQVIPGQRPGDQVGDQHRNGELPQQQEHHIADARPEHLADADFLGAAPGGEGGQTEQAHAGDEDGDGDKDREHLSLLVVGAVELFETVIEEAVRHRNVGHEGARHALDIGQRPPSRGPAGCGWKDSAGVRAYRHRPWAQAGVRAPSFSVSAVTPTTCICALPKMKVLPRISLRRIAQGARQRALTMTLWPSFFAGSPEPSLGPPVR